MTNWVPISPNLLFYAFNVCWDTPSESTGLWKLPKGKSVQCLYCTHCNIGWTCIGLKEGSNWFPLYLLILFCLTYCKISDKKIQTFKTVCVKTKVWGKNFNKFALETIQKWHTMLAANCILASIIIPCLATFCVFKVVLWNWARLWFCKYSLNFEPPPPMFST